MSKLKGRSIKSKLITYLVGLCLLSLAIVSLVVGTQIHTTLKQGAKSELVHTVSEKANQYNLIFKRLSEELDSVKIYAAGVLKHQDTLPKSNKYVLMPWVGKGTGEGVMNGYGSPELNIQLASDIPKLQQIGKMLEGVGLSNDLITLAYFASPEGMLVSDSDKVTESIGQAKAWVAKSRPWYKAAISEQKTTWTKPYIDVATKNLIVTVASPLYDARKNLLGVAAFDVLLQTIKEDILQIDIKYDSYSLLVGFDGKALVTPTTDNKKADWHINFESEDLLKTKNKGLNSIIAEMVKEKEGLGVFEEGSGGEKYLAYAPLKGLDASVGVVVSVSDVVAPAFDILKWIGLVAALISLIAIFIGVFLGNSISKPIIELTDIANNISNGKAKLNTLPVTRSDELGLLTEAFNRLISSLKIAMKLKTDSNKR